MYPATTSEELKFHLLRKSDLSPIKYLRVAEADGKEVPWKEIVKGYEYEKGKFVVLEDEDFRRADPHATQNVEILEFVPLEEIDPIYFDRPYYLEPQKSGQKPYALLRESLKCSAKVGIAKVVIKSRQRLAAVKPEENALLLELMHFSEELVKPSSLGIPGNLELGKKELEMAVELIDRMSDHWDPAKYADDYRHALQALIEKKIKSGGRTPAGASPAGRRPGKLVDLCPPREFGEGWQTREETEGGAKVKAHLQKGRIKPTDQGACGAHNFGRERSPTRLA